MREDTKKALKEYEMSTFLFKKDLEEAEKLISIDEKVIIVLTTNFSITFPDPTKRVVCPGIVFMTDKRMILYYKPLKESFSDITPISEIEKINLVNAGLNGNHIQVYTSDKIYDFLISTKEKSFAISNKQYIANKIYRAFLFAKNPNGFEHSKNNNIESESSNIDITEQIEKLSQLKDKGIITEEEFQTKKADLLARL